MSAPPRRQRSLDLCAATTKTKGSLQRYFVLFPVHTSRQLGGQENSDGLEGLPLAGHRNDRGSTLHAVG